MCPASISALAKVLFRYTSGQTDRHTDTLITILRTPTGDEVKSKNVVTAIRPDQMESRYYSVRM